MAESGEVEYVPLLSAPESDGEEEEPPTVSVQSVPENGGKRLTPVNSFISLSTQTTAYISHAFLPPVEFLLNAIPPPGRWKMESCR